MKQARWSAETGWLGPLTFAVAAGCGSSDGASEISGGSTSTDFFAEQPADFGPMLEPDATDPTETEPGIMPSDFEAADLGGWKLGGVVTADADLGPAVPADGRQDGCGSILTGVVRDIAESHPDFGGDTTGLERGLVEPALGADGNPSLSDDFDAGFIDSPATFREWYETVPGVNLPFYLSLYLEPDGDVFRFESHEFFPLDGAGFGNENEDHNFYFTFELHTRFRYDGGEVFRFSGDDDLWVFINGRLAIDLGGVHGAEDQNISLDDAANRLGIEPGNEYALDFFQAERHVTESNFQIETTLEFTSCGASILR
jgi:fibro-slime domain-containing protein